MIKIFKYFESLINKRSLNQLKKVRRISKKTDIGDRTKTKNINNLIHEVNPLDHKILTYEEYKKRGS